MSQTRRISDSAFIPRKRKKIRLDNAMGAVEVPNLITAANEAIILGAERFKLGLFLVVKTLACKIELFCPKSLERTLAFSVLIVIMQKPQHGFWTTDFNKFIVIEIARTVVDNGSLVAAFFNRTLQSINLKS